MIVVRRLRKFNTFPAEYWHLVMACDAGAHCLERILLDCGERGGACLTCNAGAHYLEGMSLDSGERNGACSFRL